MKIDQIKELSCQMSNLICVNIQFLKKCRSDAEGRFGKMEHADTPVAKVFHSNSVEIFNACRIKVFFFLT